MTNQRKVETKRVKGMAELEMSLVKAVVEGSGT